MWISKIDEGRIDPEIHQPSKYIQKKYAANYTYIYIYTKFHQKNTQTAETVHPKFQVPKNPTIFTPHMIPRRSWSAPEKGIADFIWDEALEPSEGFLP